MRAADNIQYKLLTAKYSDFDIEVTAVATSCSLPEILECDVKFLARFFDFVAEYRRDFGRQSEAFMRRLLVLSPEIPAY